ncbi:MAG: integrase family protein [Dehalococcoidales bacterium]|nr:integrase family protein [Dehalococcoidales bacterium]
MAKTKFTAGRIASFSCDAGKSQEFLWDASAPGLGLRATPRGDKSYFFQSKLDGKTLRTTIGSITNWTIPEAEAEARRLQTLIDHGHDPRQIKTDKLIAAQDVRDAREAEEQALEQKSVREAVTLGDVWPLYVKDRQQHWSDLHQRDHKKIIQKGGEKRSRSSKLTEPGPLAAFVDMRLVDITKDRVEEWAKVESKRRATRARLALRLLRACLSWCVEQKEYREILTENAAKSKRAKESLGKSRPKKEDVLQKAQLPHWFAAVRQIQNPIISAYLLCLLLTGARREEMAGLKWVDVDFRWKSIKLADKVEPFRIVPLTPFLEDLLMNLPRENEWVFYSRTSASEHITEPSIAHRKACKEAQVILTLHGIRRSFASLCAWIAIPNGVPQQIMGHTPRTAHDTYYKFWPIELLRAFHTKIETWVLNECFGRANPSVEKEFGFEGGSLKEFSDA